MAGRLSEICDIYVCPRSVSVRMTKHSRKGLLCLRLRVKVHPCKKSRREPKAAKSQSHRSPEYREINACQEFLHHLCVGQDHPA